MKKANLKKSGEISSENSSKKSSIAVAVVAVIVVAVAIAMAMIFAFSPKEDDFSKYNITTEKTIVAERDITIEVVDSEKKSVFYNVTTDAEFLRGAMDDAVGLEYSGDESQYGIMVKTVNGELADYDKNGAYWSFTVNGEYSNHGIDTQPVNDGDEFVIAYTTL